MKAEKLEGLLEKDLDIIKEAKQNLKDQIEKCYKEYRQYMQNDVEKYKKLLLRQNDLLYGTIASSKCVEWKGKTKEVISRSPLNFCWTDGYIGDISNSNLMRISIKGRADTWTTFAEEKDHFAKKINFVLGEMGNTGNGVHWQKKGDAGHIDWHRTQY